VTTTTKEGLHHRLENMDFEFYVIYCFMTVNFRDFGQHVLFWIYEYYFQNNFNFHELKLPKVNMLMGGTRRCVCLTNGLCYDCYELKGVTRGPTY
jgi:hypothetical protein